MSDSYSLYEATPAECPFAIGDTVRRTWGGPVMIVEAIDSPYFILRVRCSWNEGGQKKSSLFRVAELSPVLPQE